MSVSLSTILNGYQSFLPNGLPNAGGSIYTYLAGTATAATTYTNNGGAITNANPIPLSIGGTPPNAIWLTDGIAYKFVIVDAFGAQVPNGTFDNVTGSGSSGNSLRTDLAALTGAGLAGFSHAITYPVSTLGAKGRQVVSVADAPFNAKCDGITDDWAAIQAAQEYLKANGGGTLYFPGWCLITQPFYFYGGVTGATPIAYPNPTQPKITWRSNGAGGIRSSITSGSVLQFAKTSNPLTYNIGFKDFVIDCQDKNVVAINGNGPSGISGPNHYIDIDNLTIHGLEGAQAIGVDFGSITDSTCRLLTVQGYATGPYAGVRVNKTDVQLMECRFVYCQHGIAVGTLAEACIQMFGGSIQSSKLDCIYWEAPVADSKASASVIIGAFLGESNIGSRIVGALTPASLDVGSVTFIGCTFDNYRVGQNLMDITWGGNFTFIGNYYYNSGVGALNTIDFGQYCKVIWLNNGFNIKPGCAALAQNQVNNLIGNASPSTAPFTPALSATGATFAYAASGQVGYYTKIGNLVTVVIRLELAGAGNTFSANAVSITGLPFTSSNGTFQTAEGHAAWANLATPLVSMPGQIVQNTSVIALSKIAAASTSAFPSLLANDLANSSVIEITMQYQA